MDVRVTQDFVEVFIQPSAQDIRVTQDFIEVFYKVGSVPPPTIARRITAVQMFEASRN